MLAVAQSGFRRSFPTEACQRPYTIFGSPLPASPNRYLERHGGYQHQRDLGLIMHMITQVADLLLANEVEGQPGPPCPDHGMSGAGCGRQWEIRGGIHPLPFCRASPPGFATQPSTQGFRAVPGDVGYHSPRLPEGDGSYSVPPPGGLRPSHLDSPASRRPRSCSKEASEETSLPSQAKGYPAGPSGLGVLASDPQGGYPCAGRPALLRIKAFITIP